MNRKVPSLQDQCWNAIVNHLEQLIEQAKLRRPPTPTFRTTYSTPNDGQHTMFSTHTNTPRQATHYQPASLPAAITETQLHAPIPKRPRLTTHSLLSNSAPSSPYEVSTTYIPSSSVSPGPNTSGGIVAPSVLEWLEKCPKWMREGLLRRCLASPRFNLSVLLHFLALSPEHFIPELDFTRAQRFNPAVLIAFLQKHSPVLSSSSPKLSRSYDGKPVSTTSSTKLHPLIERMLINLYNVEHISFQANTQVTDVALYETLKYCPKLKKLNIRFCKTLTNNFILNVVPKYTCLTDLDLSWSAINDKTLCSLTTLVQLQQLSVGYCKAVTSYGVSKLLAAVTCLAVLDARGCPGIHRSLAGTTSNVKPLQIVHLNLSHGDNVSDVTLANLYCPDLQHLVLASCKQLENDAVSNLVARAPRLRLLDLQLCNKLIAPRISSPTLCTILLNDCKNMCVASINYIGQHCPELREVHLRDTQTTDETLCLLARNCVHLQVVNVSRCPAVSDAGIIELANCCSYLRDVDLSWNTSLTDRSLLVLAQCTHVMSCKK